MDACYKRRSSSKEAPFVTHSWSGRSSCASIFSRESFRTVGCLSVQGIPPSPAAQLLNHPWHAHETFIQYITTTSRYLDTASATHALPHRSVSVSHYLDRQHHQQPKGKNGHVLDLWRVTELRTRTVVSCIYSASFGFLYYGVILLSAKIMGGDSTCSFDYAILFFASSSELVFVVLTRLYLDKLEWANTATINMLASAVFTGIMPLHGSMVWLLLTSFVARGTGFVSSCLGWIIT